MTLQLSGERKHCLGKKHAELGGGKRELFFCLLRLLVLETQKKEDDFLRESDRLFFCEEKVFCEAGEDVLDDSQI